MISITYLLCLTSLGKIVGAISLKDNPFSIEEFGYNGTEVEGWRDSVKGKEKKKGWRGEVVDLEPEEPSE
jgi:hypothetical protein